MSTPDLDEEKTRQQQELRIHRQIAFASGLFQGDVTIRTLLESLTEGVVIIDNSGVILLVNTASEQMFGYQRKDLIGKHQTVIIPEFFRKITDENGVQFFAEPWISPTVPLHDLAGRRQDGSEFPVEISLNCIETINGVLIMAQVSDITIRKQLETEIQDAREYAENIVETVREPLVVLNSALKVLTANHSFYETFKVTPEDTIGNFIYDLGNRQWDIPKLRILFEDILPHDTVFNGYEVEHDFQGIGHKIILLNARQIFREKIGSHIILLAMEDITERKQLEAEIQDAREYAENIVETVREPLVVLNSALKVLTANHSFYETFKVTPEDTIGNFIYDLGNRQWDIPQLRVLFEEILPHDTVFNGYEVEHDFQGIGRKIILLNARQIFRKKIGSHIILLAMEDISERKQAEEVIKKLNLSLAARAADLEDANRELGAFNYTVAHDLRQPLNVISTCCQAIKMLYGDQLQEECMSYVQGSYEATLRMSLLIEALLDFSRMGHVEPRRDMVDLSALAHEVGKVLKLTKPERQVDFQITGGIVANGDANLLRVVLDNLIGNAWKYSGKQVNAVIEFGATEISELPTYFVRDNGDGFDKAYADKLFIPFQRLPGSEEFRGFGIGLATVERIIKRHGGRIWAEGEPGKGATFYFTLSADGIFNEFR